MIVLAVILTGIIVPLVIPVKYRINVSGTGEGFVFQVAVNYGTGIVSFFYGRDLEDRKQQLKMLGIAVRSTDRKQTGDNYDNTGLIERIAQVRHRKGLYRQMLKALMEITERCLLKRTVFNLKLGTGDPAGTGMLTGLVAAFSGCFHIPHFFEPVFTGDAPEVDFSAVGAILPIAVIMVLLKHISVYLLKTAGININA